MLTNINNNLHRTLVERSQQSSLNKLSTGISGTSGTVGTTGGGKAGDTVSTNAVKTGAIVSTNAVKTGATQNVSIADGNDINKLKSEQLKKTNDLTGAISRFTAMSKLKQTTSTAQDVNSTQGIPNLTDRQMSRINNGQTSAGTSSTTASDAVARLQVADSSLCNVSDILDRMRSIATESKNVMYSKEFQSTLNVELNSLKKEINTIAKRSFGESDSENKNKISISYSSRERDGSSRQTNVNISVAATTKGLGIDGIDISTQEGAEKSIESIDKAIDSITRSKQAVSNIMNVTRDYPYPLKQLDNIGQNSNVRVNDAGMDGDISSKTDPAKKHNILEQASVSVIAQANQPQNQILKLLS